MRRNNSRNDTSDCKINRRKFSPQVIDEFILVKSFNQQMFEDKDFVQRNIFIAFINAWCESYIIARQEILQVFIQARVVNEMQVETVVASSN